MRSSQAAQHQGQHTFVLAQANIELLLGLMLITTTHTLSRN